MFSHVLDRVASHDSSAYAELYDLTVDRVYRSIYYRVLDTYLAEDLTSRVYMKMIRSISTFRGATEGEFFAWILRIAYHTVIDEVRTTEDSLSLDEIAFEGIHTEDYARQIDAKSKLEEVLSFMKTFSERDRMILIYRIWEDLSYDEISEITGESVSNCKKIVSRSLEKISANISYLFYLSILLHHVS